MDNETDKIVQDCICTAVQNIQNAANVNDGMTAVVCLLGSIAHSLIAIAELMRDSKVE